MIKQLASACVLTGLLAGCSSADKMMMKEDTAPFGGPSSLAYAADLWQALNQAGLAGKGALQGTPYTGQHPHGAILDTLDSTLTVNGHTGVVIVKRNYSGDGVSKQAVADDPAAYLKAVTVMFKREADYDSDNKDWFWAKYLPDGSLDQNPAMIKLAGRVAKGADAGCIACHQAAPGGDFVFNNDRF